MTNISFVQSLITVLTLEAQVSEYKYRDTDVVSDEVCEVPRHEGIKALEDGEHDCDAKREVGQVWLEGLRMLADHRGTWHESTHSNEGKSGTGNALRLHTSHEANVTGKNANLGS